jgi:RHS repeat-associated protein
MSSVFGLQTSVFCPVPTYTYDYDGTIQQRIEPTAHTPTTTDRTAAIYTETPANYPSRPASGTPTTNSAEFYYGYRYYSPELGRWVNRDPIREEGSIVGRFWSQPARPEAEILETLSKHLEIVLRSEHNKIVIARLLLGEYIDSGLNRDYIALSYPQLQVHAIQNVDPFYVFVRNKPISFIDPFGLEPDYPGVCKCFKYGTNWGCIGTDLCETICQSANGKNWGGECEMTVDCHGTCTSCKCKCVDPRGK